MSTGVTNLYDLGVALLAAVNSAFLEDGVTLPAKQAVISGDPVAECEAVYVSFNSTYTGVPGLSESPTYVNASGQRVAVFTIWIFHCVAVVDGEGPRGVIFPSSATQQAEARTFLTDAYVLHRGIGRAKGEGTLRDVCNALSVGAAQAINPEGGMGGIRMQVTAEAS